MAKESAGSAKHQAVFAIWPNRLGFVHAVALLERQNLQKAIMTSLRSSAANASGAIHPTTLGFGATKRVALGDAIDVRSTTYLVESLANEAKQIQIPPEVQTVSSCWNPMRNVYGCQYRRLALAKSEMDD